MNSRISQIVISMMTVSVIVIGYNILSASEGYYGCCGTTDPECGLLSTYGCMTSDGCSGRIVRTKDSEGNPVEIPVTRCCETSACDDPPIPPGGGK